MIDLLRARPDVAQRSMMDELKHGPIYKIVRMISHGPRCPVAIQWIETLWEPVVIENDMRGTRSPHVAGLISGQWYDPVKLYMVGGASSQRITREQYDALIAEIKANIAANRYEPRSQPWKAVDLSRVAIPFSDSARV